MGADRESEQSIEEERELQRAVDRFGERVHEMEQRSDQLGEEIDTTRQDWQRKRADERVPGANPPQGDGGDEEPEDGGEEPASEADS